MLRGPSILVVDEDPAVRLLLRRGLCTAGYHVQEAEPEEAEPIEVADKGFDLLILDVDAAGGGTDTIRSIRKHSAIPIVALSTSPDEKATVAALDSGADDFVRKPFGESELLARVRNALRRRAAEQGQSCPLVSGDLEIDLLYRRVRVRGQIVHLSAKPYAVLRILAENAEKVVSHEELMHAVWGGYVTKRVPYLRVAIRTLRQALEIDPPRPRLILTETRVGYRLQLQRCANDQLETGV